MASARKTTTRKTTKKSAEEPKPAAETPAPAKKPEAAKKPREAKARQTFGIRRVESILEELDAMREAITRRAYEIFASRGGSGGGSVEDWVAAEGELTWKPAIELVEKDGTLTLEAAAAGLEPGEIEVQVTREHILIKSERTHEDSNGATVHVCEFVRGQLFRDVALPSPIDPEGARAEYRNGLLKITAPIVGEDSHRVHVSSG